MLNARVGGCSKVASVLLLILVTGSILLRAGLGDGQKALAKSLYHGSLQREYRVYVPQGVVPDRPIPVVFVYHGGSATAWGTMRLVGFNALADEHGFIVVYPQGIGRSWNDGRSNGETRAHREKVDDVGFFDAMLVDLGKEYALDPKRLFVTGCSNGGMFAHYLAANRADKIAAIAPVVGGITEPFDQQFQPSSAVSVLIVQGTDDPIVPYEGGSIQFPGSKDRGRVIATEKAASFWVASNGCDRTEIKKEIPDKDPKDGCQIDASVWSDGKDRSEVWLFRLVGGGHTWPGGSQYLPRALIGRVCHDIDSETIWSFFQTHPKP